MSDLISLGRPNSQPLKIYSIERKYDPAVKANSSYLRKLKIFTGWLLAFDPTQGWHRPAPIRLEKFEAELRSAFLGAGLDKFVNDPTTTLSSEELYWNPGSMLTDSINLKLGLDLSETNLWQDLCSKNFQELLPILKSALVSQEIDRLVTTELGIAESDVLPSLRLNPDKGQENHTAIDMVETDRCNFIEKVAENFAINAKKLIADFESTNWESLSCLYDAVLNQTSVKYGTNKPQNFNLLQPVDLVLN